MSLPFNTKPFNSYLNIDNHLVLEVAVAGFDEADLSIERVGQNLYISGQKSDKPVEVKQFFNRGISYRPFRDTFQVASHWKLLCAELIFGILRIKFEEQKETLPITVKVKALTDKAIQDAANSSKVLEAA